MKSCTRATLTVTAILSVILSWFMLVLVLTSTSTGSVSSLDHLSDSQGVICGEGSVNMDGDSERSVNKGRGFLLYFEVSKCAGLMADEICRSTQVPDLNNSNNW